MIRPEDYEFAHGVHVSRSAVERIWPLPVFSEVAANSAGTEKRARSGGRPTTHDWAQAAGYAAAYIVEHEELGSDAIGKVLLHASLLATKKMCHV